MRLILSCMFTFFIVSQAAYADMVWKKISSGISADEFNCAAVDERDAKTVYAGTVNGLYKTTDGGTNWRRVFTGWGARKNVRDIYLSQDEIIISTGRGLMLHENKEGTWKASGGIASESPVMSIAVSGDQGRMVYVVTGNGIYKSSDGRSGWKRVLAKTSEESRAEEDPEEEDSQEPSCGFRCISISKVSPSRLYIGTDEGIYFSDDGGNSQTRLEDAGLIDNSVNFITESYPDEGTLYAVTASGIFFFKDAWQRLETQKYMGEPRSIAFGPAKGRQVIIATSSGVYISDGQAAGEAAARNEIRNIMEYFNGEPTVRQVQNEAIRYGEVHPHKITSWRARANMSAILPSVSFGLEKDKSKSLHWDSGANPDVWVVGPEDESRGWDIALSWDLSELIWSPDQTSIDVRSKLMVQLRDDIMDEVTGYYFERRKLQLELLKGASNDIDSTIGKELRLQELTAHIDVLTGGYFCRALAKKR